MKDIKGRIVKKGDDVIVLENGNRVPATVLGVNKTKVKLKLREGVVIVNQSDVNIQKIVAKGLIDNKNTSGLLEDIFKNTNPVKNSRDNIPGIQLDTLRIFGVGFDTKHPAMRVDENQQRINNYGKVYRLLKEAFDVSCEDEELTDVAEAISKLATYLSNKMDD
jgi:hypothetical protein